MCRYDVEIEMNDFLSDTKTILFGTYSNII